MLGDYKLTIKIFGIGGGGCNAISRIAEHIEEFGDIQLIAANTDSMSLANIGNYNFVKTIQLGEKKTKGMGAGALPEVGRLATEESYEEIAESIKDADLLFITAGMGGGTGTGAAPIVASCAKELGILTIGVVTKPFSFEGKVRMNNAINGITNLKESVDTLIIIPNDRLLDTVNNVTFTEAFCIADDVLRQGIQGISDLISQPGIVNLDFADIRTIMRERGMAHMGIGMASGENRSIEAARQAVESNLLETSITGARGLIINITGGPQMGLKEVNEAAEYIRDFADPGANIIFGAGIDDELGDSIRITVIATGFEGAEQVAEKKPENAVRQTIGSMKAQKSEPKGPEMNWYERPRTRKPEYSNPLPDGEEVTPHITRKDLNKAEYNPKEKNNLDLPSFLRNRGE